MRLRAYLRVAAGDGVVVENFAENAVPGAFFCLGFALGCVPREDLRWEHQ